MANVCFWTQVLEMVAWVGQIGNGHSGRPCNSMGRGWGVAASAAFLLLNTY